MSRLPLILLAGATCCAAGCIDFGTTLADLGLFGFGSAPTQAASAAAPGGPTLVSSAQSQALSGVVSGRGNYQMFELGGSAAGDEWTVSWSGAPLSASPFIVVLFDDRNELLYRAVLSAGGELRHVMRADTSRALIGITPANGSNGGRFSFAARRRTAVSVPAPRKQVVWLNFGGGHDVRVHGRAGISFGPFDAAVLDAGYVGETDAIVHEIAAQVRADYDPYDVIIQTSYEGPPPAEPHTVIHFGGDDHSLLGLADNVDLYNANPVQTAVIFTDAFAAYSTMQLEPAEMAVMIANVASHELGHLLGLYHTRNPVDVMDTTGSAWDLAGEQWFGSVELEPSVFPTGFENSPLRLNETVGPRPLDPATDAAAETPAGTAKPGTLKPQIRELLRNFTHEELQHACGTCVELDGGAE